MFFYFEKQEHTGAKMTANKDRSANYGRRNTGRIKAVAYMRTSSATNVGGDSDARQRGAIASFAKHNGYAIAEAECVPPGESRGNGDNRSMWASALFGAY